MSACIAAVRNACRWLVGALCGLSVLVAAGEPTLAQPYPNRPIKMIVPFPPGGPTDVIARVLSDRMASTLGQSVIIEHRPGGAGGTVGAKAVAHSEPDGYTLLLANVGTFTISPATVKLDYEPIKSFSPIALVVISPQIVVVNPALPVRSVRELVAYAKANPGKLSYGSPGAGTQPHLIGEMIKKLAGIDILHVPYRGSAPAITDLLANQVQLYIDTPLVLTPHIQAGKLRTLGVTSATRSQQFGDLPTLAETGFPTMDASFWTGLAAPAGTAAPIVEKLNATVNEALGTPEVKATLVKLGVETKIGSSKDFVAFFATETRKWAEVAKTTGIKIGQ